MAEGVEPVSREWQRALGLQDCMVMVGGRLDIPDFEPIPVTNDSMCTAVEILWSRPRPSAKSQTGDYTCDCVVPHPLFQKFANFSLTLFLLIAEGKNGVS